MTHTTEHQHDTPLHIVVVGAGAVGAVLGGRLAHGGADVTFLARGATLAALRARGLALEGPHGDVHLPPGHATDRPDDVGPVDVVLVAVKAEQVPTVAPTLAPLVGPATVVVPLQNGVDASGQLAAVLGEANVAEGLCRLIAWQTAPGRVSYTGPRPSIAYGARASHPLAAGAQATLDRLGDACQAGGVTVDIPDDAAVALWEKFLFVEPLGAVGAAARVPFADLLAVPETRAVLEACGHEIMAVGRACGVALPDSAYAETWQRYDGLPADGTASMQRDLMAGRPSELDAQTGAIVRRGRSHGVPTPVHDLLYAVLRTQERRARMEVAPRS